MLIKKLLISISLIPPLNEIRGQVGIGCYLDHISNLLSIFSACQISLVERRTSNKPQRTDAPAFF